MSNDEKSGQNPRSTLTERQRRQIAGAVAEVDPAQIQITCRLTPAQRTQQALSMIQLAERAAAYRLRSRKPGLSERESLWQIRRQDSQTYPREENGSMLDPLLNFNHFIRNVIDALEEADIVYLAGGSVAVWGWGEPRTTMDFDVVVNLPFERISSLSKALLSRDMNVPSDIILDVLLSPTDLAINAIHQRTGFKAELFPLRPGDRLRESALERRLIIDLGEPIGELYVHSPEDLIIYKVLYYSLSEQTKHVRDIAGIMRTVGHELEMDYLHRWIATLDLDEIWQEIQSQLSA
ncbi:hypothetical protein GC175_19555 [bacterium]|nr:hypothetical protein [bacterium]